MKPRKHTHRKAKSSRPKSEPEPTICFADAHIVVVDKPAGLTTVRHAHELKAYGDRARQYLPPTLADVLPSILAKHHGSRPGRVFAVHRLDKETSGLIVFARTKQAERSLGKQLRANEIHRKYLALVRGQAVTETISSNLVRDRGDGRRGSADKGNDAKHAVTHVRLLENLEHFSFVECVLETGRTHQVRIHLGERGTPLCGERVYDRPLHGQPLPDDSQATRPMLHAAYLQLVHPVTGKEMSWTAKLPADMKTLLRDLRKRL